MGDIAELREAFLVGSVEPNYIALRERPDPLPVGERAVDEAHGASCWCFAGEFHVS
jgi:hypothetical protein